jgi:Flp pilus assembly protein TadG
MSIVGVGKGYLRGKRGATIVFVAAGIAALLAIVALAVDVGMLFTARGEAQRAADSAALAGAGSLIVQPGDEDRARQGAIDFGDLNTVRSDDVEVLPEDVVVDLAQERVTVTVRRVAERGSAVATWFANVFGVSEVDVAALATAEASPAGRAKCVKPFTIPDKYEDVDDDNAYEEGVDVYDPHSTGYGTSFRNAGQPGDDGLGYVNDRGRPIIIKGGGPHGDGCCPNTGPGWYYLWAFGGRGGATVRDNIRDRCNFTDTESVGDEEDTEPGNKYGPARQGFEDLYAQDPGAEWDEDCDCLVGSKYGASWEASERIGIIPVFDPGRAFRPGRKPITFSNFIAVFLESIEGKGNNQTLHARVLYATGVGGGEETGPGIKFLRLVE